MKEELWDYLGNCFGGIIAIVFFIVLIPIIIIFLPFGIYQSNQLEKRFQAFLKEHNGQNYFIYNNGRKSQNFIEENALPKIPTAVNILYLKKKELQVKKNKEFFSMMVYRIKNYKRFPHLIKIRNGEIIDISINQELFAWKNQGKGSKQFFDLINIFFDLKEEYKELRKFKK